MGETFQSQFLFEFFILFLLFMKEGFSFLDSFFKLIIGFS